MLVNKQNFAPVLSPDRWMTTSSPNARSNLASLNETIAGTRVLFI